jgi:hypothetical protein
MPQVRVVLRDEVVEQGERLRQVTKTGSLSELVGLMFSRYGRHLEQTWEVIPVSPTYAQAEPLPDVVATIAPMPETNFTFDQPLSGL